ncbi:uncharacterized protein SAPINGB_P001113 [Magnusiomyces paraingens]|uniref:RING-CH-type domain-containing protein n=1 Tax=Magnusiomyces paraingens TaxID=2606893 RepID=A0A5E8B5W2_9ASCO|nr:uncharacterized protein SAPINGB_P001113 [Saprochaete ingens]VVT46235.1 unnamed protein product [Saprochaete ingens]
MSAPGSPSSEKRCWICLETDETSDPSCGPWREVCTCNLVAHEGCLLKWAASVEQKDPNKPLTCPQCLRKIHIVKESNLFLNLRDSIESFNSQTANALILSSVGGGIVLFFYTSLYTIGSSVIRSICPSDMADSVLGITSDKTGIRTLELTTKTTAIPALVPILLVLARRTSNFANAALCLSPLLMASKDTPIWKFRDEKLALALYPFLRLGYLKLYEKLVQPIIISIGKQMKDSRVKPSGNDGALLEGFNFEVVVEDELIDLDDDDDDDLGINFMGPILGGIINWFRGNNRNANQQANNVARLNNHDRRRDDQGANAENNGEDHQNENENDNDNANEVNNNDDDDDDDDMNWIVSKQRLSLQIGYALIWPWLSGTVGTMLGNIPIIQKYIPSAFNRNLLGSILIVALRDCINLLTAYLRLKQERTAHVLSFEEVLTKQLDQYMNNILWR